MIPRPPDYPPDYKAVFDTLHGYVEEALSDGNGIDPHVLLEFMLDLRRQYVTDPARARWLG